jgi:hypothetical protein
MAALDIMKQVSRIICSNAAYKSAGGAGRELASVLLPLASSGTALVFLKKRSLSAL